MHNECPATVLRNKLAMADYMDYIIVIVPSYVHKQFSVRKL